jgi:hypothetical protein
MKNGRRMEKTYYVSDTINNSIAFQPYYCEINRAFCPYFNLALMLNSRGGTACCAPTLEHPYASESNVIIVFIPFFLSKDACGLANENHPIFGHLILLFYAFLLSPLLLLHHHFL